MRRTEPHDDAGREAVDKLHHAHLGCALGDVGLVDAESIDPERCRDISGAVFVEEKGEVGCYGCHVGVYEEGRW